MTSPLDSRRAALRGVLQTPDPEDVAAPRAGDLEVSCARCGASIRPTAQTWPRRFCSATCRRASRQECRASAYADLLLALLQLAVAASRIERDLRVMGFNSGRRGKARQEVLVSDDTKDRLPVAAAAREVGVPERSHFRAVADGRVPRSVRDSVRVVDPADVRVWKAARSALRQGAEPAGMPEPPDAPVLAPMPIT